MLNGQPSFRIEIPDAASIGWARVSSDGNLLVASLSTPTSEQVVWSVAAFDLVARREIWRVHLNEDGHARPDDCFFLRSGVLVATSGPGGAHPALVVLDRTKGAPTWIHTVPEAKRGDDVRVLVAGEDRDDILIAETLRPTGSWVQARMVSLRVLDARTGAASDILSAHLAPVDAVAPPEVTHMADAVYVVDQGLSRVPGPGRQVWSHPFETDANLRPPSLGGMAIPFVLPFPPAFVIGFVRTGGPMSEPFASAGQEMERVSEAVEVDGKACVGSFGVVSCFNAATGEHAWSRRFPVTQFRTLAGVPGSLCALAGGRYLVRRGDALEAKESPYRGLYCVDPRDGAPLATFSSPLTSNHAGIPMSDESLSIYEPSDDDAQLAAHGMPEEEKSLRLGAIAAVGAGLLVAQDGLVHLLELPSGRMLSTTDLGNLGAVRHFARVPGLIVASLTGGFAAFDAESGVPRWRQSFASGVVPEVAWSDHDSLGLVRTDEPFRDLAARAEGRWKEAPAYWLLPDARTLIAPASDGGLVGVSLDDGAQTWRLKPSGAVTVEGSPDHPALVALAPSRIRVYRIPGRTSFDVQ